MRAGGAPAIRSLSLAPRGDASIIEPSVEILAIEADLPGAIPQVGHRPAVDHAPQRPNRDAEVGRRGGVVETLVRRCAGCSPGGRLWRGVHDIARSKGSTRKG